ncbi:MAG TPA: NAD-glutamate dehydrogenase [Polyangiaceae bacterium]|nr:NAD-glutamate dehydrogenase [Polyangiaceae bacterium]
MASSIEMLKVDLVDQLEHMARMQLEHAHGEIVAPFIRKLYADVPPSDLVPERPEELVAAALSLFEFLQDRARGSSKVRVYEAASALRPDHRHTIIDIVNDDMPFLVDSVRGVLERSGLELRLLLHPILEIERDERHRLRGLRVAEFPAPGCAESVMQIWLAGVAPEDHPQLEAQLTSVLHDVRCVVQDFAPMRDHCLAEANTLRAGVPPSSRQPGEQRMGASAEETSQFLDWLADAHFVFQGYSYCRFERAPVSARPVALTGRLPLADAPPSAVRFERDSGLGILRDPSRSVFDVFEPPRKRELLRVLKANRHSTVHRTVHLDTVLVSDIDEHGVQRGAHMFVGLFTASAYTSSPSGIPVLHHKLMGVMMRTGFLPHSYNYRRLHYILETYPRDELFQISDADLYSIALGIFHLHFRKRVALFARRDPFGRFMSCLVYLPRDRMETALRHRIESILERELDGSLSAYYPLIGDDPLARLHYIIKTPNGIPEQVDFVAIERQIETTTRSWQDRLALTLPDELGAERGMALLRRYADAFPANYREDFDEVVAVNDIESIEEAVASNRLTLQLYRAESAPAHELRFKVVSPQAFVAPSEILPILENLGLRVVAQVPYEIQLPDRRDPVWLHDFSLVVEDKAAVDLGQSCEAFYEVFSKTWDKRVDDDAFNKLVLQAGLSARQVALLRAYAKYLRQIQVPFSEGYMQQTLRRNARITRSLIALFDARFHPEARDDQRAGQIEAQLARDLDAVQSLDEDRILRLFLGVFRATVRTNFWQRDAAGELKDHISFKLDSGRLPEVPKPAPFREIFVSGPRVEGVHLRFGEVARGGLRWSDRLEDFRTEILGLCKAQQVKNAVIVPVGSKGGFVVKRPPAPDAGRDAQRAEGIACYQIFVSSLLDLTDNRRHASNGNGKAQAVGSDVIVPPSLTVCHDAVDPYLVVAADKGTATFSDIANRLSEERGFWLDDAFASGGSAGYDHKKMGITARGAWECVKRHFRELGKDIQRQDFTCIGVGDMSGDVFGNGLLLSRHTKLVAAFDHRHIFLDPDPDPERSWQERQRLFQLDRSSWDDYDRSLISQGGGVYARSLKRIPLSPEVRALLGENLPELDPPRLIQAILRARVELCFFGGIGTYVKAGTESDAQVGDRSNDALRINGSELRAMVVGEGANLAMTQRGRIEYSRAGGRCNTDFIDNSAGVDCSDHEVNLKILFGDVERRGGMSREQRNDLLRDMTDEVAALVLRDNYLQSQTLSISTQLSQHLTDRLARTMRNLEKSGKLHRRLEALPDDDVLADRQRVGAGFVRPELCVLLAYAKNSLAESLLASELPDDPLLQKDFFEYFPEPLRERYREYIQGHRLRREILVTVITNDLVNRVGIAFVDEVGEATGASPAQVTLAYIAAREILGARELWAQIEALDNLAAAHIQGELLVETSRLIERVTTWLLHEHAGAQPQALVARYRAGVEELRSDLSTLLTKAELAALREQAKIWTKAGVPESLAERVGGLQYLLPSVDIVRVAELARVSLDEAGQLYFKVGRKFGFDWLRNAARALPTLRAWDRQAVAALRDELFASQREVTLAILQSTPADQDGAARLQAWGAVRHAALARSERLVAELRATQAHDFAMLTVAARQLESLSRTSAGPVPPGVRLLDDALEDALPQV